MFWQQLVWRETGDGNSFWEHNGLSKEWWRLNKKDDGCRNGAKEKNWFQRYCRVRIANTCLTWDQSCYYNIFYYIWFLIPSFFFFNFPIISNLVVAWQRRKILCWSACHLTLSLRNISLEIPSPEWASVSVSSRWRRSTRYPLDPFQVWPTIVKAILLLHS